MKNIIRYISITGVFIVFALLASCKSDNNSTFFPGNDKFAGNKQMADSLTAIYKRTDFYNHPYEKSEFIKMLEKELSAMHNVPINKMINYAIELTRGGEIDKAIAVLEKLFAEVPDLKSINKQDKWVYELLAIAYMRKGEVDNCIMNHNEESCLFPIKGKGIHQAQTGSSAAIKLYSQILDKFPEDLQSQYLINLAYMTLGKFPDDVPKKWLLPLNKLTSSGNMPKFENIAIKLGFAFNELSGGVIMDDFDNDGFKDVIISSWGMKDQLRYFRNKGDGSFEDRTKEAGLIGLTGGLNMKQADIDNDGNLDFFVLRGSWKALTRMGIQPNSLLRNNGDGTFSDITIKAGLYTIRPTQTAEFFDFNNDGFVDLFIGNETVKRGEIFPCEFYVNNGDGTFTDMAAHYKMDVKAYVKGVSSGDVNNDGLLDLYVSILDGPNKLFINRGGTTKKDWRWEFGETFAEVEKPIASFPCWFFDVNNDGFDDLFASPYDSTAFLSQAHEFAADMLGLKVKAELPKLYLNNQDGTFSDETKKYNLAHPFGTMGSNYGDIDNDGWLDFYLGTGAPDFRSIVPNRMFHNLNGKVFEEVTTATNTGHVQKGHAISFADLDNDGDYDIYANMGGAFSGDKFQDALFENPGNPNKWIAIVCEGTKTNKAAIGSKIKLTVIEQNGAERVIYKTVNAGGSFGANSLEQLIGLGNAKDIKNVEVKFANGSNKYTSYGHLEPGKKYKLTEGQNSGVEKPYKKIKLTGDGKMHDHHHM